jgi:ferredoxin
MKTLITCTVNGEERSVLADTRDTLLELLRDRIGLTGTKEGCGNGNCGTCTVLVDGAGERHPHDRGARRQRFAASDPAGAGRLQRHSVRLLYPRHRAFSEGPARRQPAADRGRDPPRHRR